MKEVVIAAGTEILAHLRGAECCQDQSLSSHAKLLAAVLDARIRLNLAQSSHRDLINDTAGMLVEGLHSRERMIELHGKYATIAERLGIEPSAFGDGGAKADVVMPGLFGQIVPMPARAAA